MTEQIQAIKKINFPNAIAVSLSVANIVLAFPFFFIIAEYYDIFAKGALSHLQFHSVIFDTIAVVLAVFVCVSSIGVVIRYFQHKNVKLLMPVLFFSIYSLMVVASALSLN